MRYIIALLLLLASFNGRAQDSKIKQSLKKTFKYSTFYTSMTMGTSMTEREDYVAFDKGRHTPQKLNLLI